MLLLVEEKRNRSKLLVRKFHRIDETNGTIFSFSYIHENIITYIIIFISSLLELNHWLRNEIRLEGIKKVTEDIMAARVEPSARRLWQFIRIKQTNRGSRRNLN